MTERLGLVVAIAGLTYLTRYAGFRLGEGRALPPAFERFLAYVPVAAFAALVAPGVADGPGGMPARFVAVALAVAVGLWLRRLWASLALGMVGFWVVDWML